MASLIDKAKQWIAQNPTKTPEEIWVDAFSLGIAYAQRNAPKDKSEIIKKKKAEFKEMVRPYVPMFGRDLCNNFYSYWAEANTKTGKLRWEGEKSFEVDLRLKTWKRREEERKNPKENAKPSGKKLEILN